jgi:hypothetical protein
VELSLAAGDAVECAVEPKGQQCGVKFDIDQGRNRHSLNIGPGELTIDDKRLRIDENYKVLSIDGTPRTLEIKADARSIAKWSSDMQDRVSSVAPSLK